MITGTISTTVTNPITALTFGNVNSDRVDLINTSATNTLSQKTVLALVRPTSFASSYFIFNKRTAGSAIGFRLRQGSGQLQWAVSRAISGLSYNCSQASIGWTLNEWSWVGATYDEQQTDSSLAAKLYGGTFNIPINEPSSYLTQTIGSGSTSDDSSALFRIGNAETTAQAWIGQIAIVAIFNRVLVLDEIQSFQQQPRINVNGTRAVGFWRLGSNGIGTQVDETGNGADGTVTGATLTSGPDMIYF